MIDPIEFITRLREIYPERYEKDSGGCLKFHLLLKAMYPQAVGWYDADHVVTEIGGVYYDIDGFAARPERAVPIGNYGRDYFNGWSHLTSRIGEVAGCH